MNLKRLQKKSNRVVNTLIDVLTTRTQENPLELFTPEQTDDDHEDYVEVYDYPYGYYVTKHGFYVQGNVMKLHNKTATLFLTGEDWGELYELPINELPIESMIALLSYLK